MLALRSPFLHCPIKLPPYASSPPEPPRIRRLPPSCPRITAIDLDQSTVVAITVGVVSVAVGIGIQVFYETQIDNAAKRENTQPCFPCNGSGAQMQILSWEWNRNCRTRRDEEVSGCINCDGIGSLTCTTCQGSGIQPRYLDRSYTYGRLNEDAVFPCVPELGI